ncbi:hypothetical protein RSOL_158900 [Rhizoctonia solani AG-3 Rhs1AP]|uniref:Uncharacterized protein n=1 Tax=Rhizoctonia solani AG-3 Rhs1AP TaxID=1086054 RepID=X8J2E8_9AGAM|nr:hypothetical protein RSOL_158900 [Rhizoctonia solani AG-3 Rhs1AP]
MPSNKLLNLPPPLLLPRHASNKRLQALKERKRPQPLSRRLQGTLPLLRAKPQQLQTMMKRLTRAELTQKTLSWSSNKSVVRGPRQSKC